jgi:uncharacterized phage protein (TIGR01671 family)
MREIKFRAWHRDAKEMLYPENNRQDYVFYWEHEGQPVEIMQFTGLKDKNGKEIYEGDIVSCAGNNSMFGEVVFIDGSFKYINSGESNKDHNRGEYISLYNGDKVIGNIYENPKLL